MPNIKSAKKRVKITAKKTLRNKILKSKLKTFLRNARKSDCDQASILKAISQVDKSVSKGIIHKNTAARIKSKLSCQACAKL